MAVNWRSISSTGMQPTAVTKEIIKTVELITFENYRIAVGEIAEEFGVGFLKCGNIHSFSLGI